MKKIHIIGCVGSVKKGTVSNCFRRFGKIQSTVFHKLFLIQNGVYFEWQFLSIDPFSKWSKNNMEHMTLRSVYTIKQY